MKVIILTKRPLEEVANIVWVKFCIIRLQLLGAISVLQQREQRVHCQQFWEREQHQLQQQQWSGAGLDGDSLRVER